MILHTLGTALNQLYTASRVPWLFLIYWYSVIGVLLKKNMNASKPSEHSPVIGGKCKKNVQVGIDIECKDKNSSWDLIGLCSPMMAVPSGQQHYIEEKPIFILYTYIKDRF